MAVAVAAIAYVTPDHWPPLATLALLRCERSGNSMAACFFLIARDRLARPVARLQTARNRACFPEAAL